MSGDAHASVNCVIIALGNCLSPIGFKTLPWPLLAYRQLEPQQHISMRVYSQFNTFSFKKMCLKLSSANVGRFCLSLNKQWVCTITFMTSHERLCVSDDRQLDFFFSRLFRLRTNKHQSFAIYWFFVRWIHRSRVDSPHKEPVANHSPHTRRQLRRIETIDASPVLWWEFSQRQFVR